jgi:glucose-1-phosphate cytidylyltransferase
VRPVSRFGILEIDDNNLARRFAEKPKDQGWINAGYFVFNRKVFDYIDGGDKQILEHEPLARLAAEGQLMAFRHDGFFYAMDTFREYEVLNQMWNSGKAPWKVWS